MADAVLHAEVLCQAIQEQEAPTVPKDHGAEEPSEAGNVAVNFGCANHVAIRRLDGLGWARAFGANHDARIFLAYVVV